MIEHRLGKGEVVSSILTGSTTNPHGMGISGDAPEAYSAVSGRTEHEHDKSGRGKSVESVRALSAARASLRSKLSTEPEPVLPYIKNVITTLSIVLGKYPADQKDAARRQTLRNIAMLERERAKQTKDVA